MRNYFKLLAFLFLLASLSCSSKKNIVYFQDISDNNNLNFEFVDHKIKPGDILSISILIDNPENLVSLNNANPTTALKNRESKIFDGYIVDKNGFIEYPQIGNVKLGNLSIEDAKLILKNKLSDLQILTNPIIDLKVLNWNFTIIGEVNRPGKYYFDEPNFNFLQAIGVAGDLTINGQRDKIKLIRNIDGNLKSFDIDLTKSDFINQISFQIFSGDIIVINPNLSRVKNAGIIGNSGTLVSLLSFLLSSIIIISSN